ncbi:MAG: SusC/RagA family TonB-linked outer membrane protein [Alistipes sp.]|nr:SusC/RagA family TonB-linked outer membrane protein [Alistipes sp.]
MTRYFFRLALSGLLCILSVSRAWPVGDAGSGRAAQGPDLVELSTVVTDEDGRPLQGIFVISGEGRFVGSTDRNGRISFSVPAYSEVKFEGDGYEKAVFDLAVNTIPTALVLYRAGLFTSEENLIDRLDGNYTSRKFHVGAVSSANMNTVRKYPDLTVTNGLQGKAAGLIVRQTTNGLGMNVPNVYVRGQHTNSSNAALVIIDGIERPLEDVLPEEIESIEVLKDAVSKSIYGPAAANGVVMVTTKRGAVNSRIIRTSFEYGAMPSTRSADWLDAYTYANLFNEARVNDGLPAFYQQYQLDGYRNSSGPNDLLYPDVDWKKTFLRSQSTYRKAVVEFFGGNNNVQYSMVTGYLGGSGLEKVGKRQNLNRFNLRGNLDVRLNDLLSVHTGVSGRIEVKDWGPVSGVSLFDAIATRWPNEYPLVINAADIGLPETEDGIPYFGASSRYSDNLYADMMYGGKESERYASSQSNLGLKFDFNKYVRGLTAQAYVTFDIYNYTKQLYRNYYPTYSIETYQDASGQLVVEPVLRRLRNVGTNDWDVSDFTTKRSLGWRFDIAYQRQIDKHSLSAVLASRYFKEEFKGQTHNEIEMNHSMRLNYVWDGRLIAEFSLSAMGSNRFAKGNKYFTAPAGGLAWILSNEGFLRGNTHVNFLKVKASAGLLGFSGNTAYNLYRTVWYENGTTPFNEQNNTSHYLISLIRQGNPDLKWERSAELNLGVEGLFLGNRLGFEVNWFREVRSNIIGTATSSYSAVVGEFTMAENIGKVRNAGIDATVYWMHATSGDFSFRSGVNFLYSKNKLLEWNYLEGTEDYRRSIGRPTDAVFGLQALGLFGRDVTLAGYPFQTYGPYGTGDIAYADLNDDGIVDDLDQRMIGNSFPRTTWGIDFDLTYKGWGLYLMFTAETGVGQVMTNNFFWNYGEGKYSTLAPDRYHPTNNPSGNYPRLTTTDGTNNFRTSSFWYRKTDFLRLKNIEVSYTFTVAKSSSALRKITVFGRGTNVFVLSPFKDLDPEAPLSGVTNYPVYSAYTGGVTLTF